jgi:hypothetical protein
MGRCSGVTPEKGQRRGIAYDESLRRRDLGYEPDVGTSRFVLLGNGRPLKTSGIEL